MKNTKHSQQDLGFKRPNNHTEESKKADIGVDSSRKKRSFKIEINFSMVYP